MTYKKTWLSYLLWAVYTCLTGVMLANYTVLFWQKKINSVINYGTALFVIFVFGIATGLYILIRYIFGKVREKYNMSSHTKLLWEIFIALSIFFTGLLYRVSLYLQNANALAETSFYQMATVKAERAVEPMVHGASYLYTMCLSFVLSFLGNKIAAAVWMQILIQMAAIPLAFFAVRRLAGRIPACIAMFVLAVSSVYAEQILVMTPESLFFVLYLVGIFIIGGYVKHTCQNRADRWSAFPGALLSGFIIGFLTYLDALALTLILFLFGLLTGVCCEKTGKKQKKKAAKERNTGFSVLLTGAALIAGGLTFAGMLALNAYSCYTEVETMAEAWFGLYREHLARDYIFYRTEYSIVECFILVIPAFWLIMAFWNRRKVQNVTSWMILMFLLAPTPLTAVGVLSYQTWSVFLWGVLAGIGVQQSLVWEKSVSIRREAAAESGSARGEEQVVKTDSAPEEKQVVEADSVPEEEQIKKADSVSKEEQAVEAVSVSEEKPVAVSGSVLTEEPPAKPHFLKNPLPLPKKHEKRTMDYQYEIEEDRLKFDIEIDEDDDFDIL